MSGSPLLSQVPDERVRTFGDRQVRADGDYVLYWMIANRRARWNYSLDRALQWCQEQGKPLIVLEALRCDYPWASDRLHRFVIQGMADNAAALQQPGVLYYPYVEPARGAGSGLLRALAERAAVVVSDDFPCFFLPAMLRTARRQIGCRFELVDSNGIWPMRATDRVFSRAFDFRRFLQKNLRPHLIAAPAAEPFAGRQLPPLPRLPADIQRRWPVAEPSRLLQNLGDLPIDHRVLPGLAQGGAVAGNQLCETFVADRLSLYSEKRNQPEVEAASGLSPYLHFGHLSVHQVFAEAAWRDGWHPGRLSEKTNGSSKGWWGGGEDFESFVDELITWRELGYNRCALTTDYDRYESLPEWARRTLDEHARDPREHLYSLAEFEQAGTHDPLWNAAQRQLVSEGRIHNYLRMLWGKKILEWTYTPQEALSVMLQLNNKYALDGRNPNSYSGIFWVLGRYDRAWGPERPIFGKIRYMSSENTARKVRVKDYIARYQRGERSLFV